jgi:hypothetical protein
VLYLEGQDLRAFELSGGRSTSLGRVPADGAVASPDGRSIAEVVPLEAATGAQRDFVIEPELRVLDLASGRESTVGPGFSPLWSPNGEDLVYLRPQRPRRCSGEVCEGRAELVHLDLASGRQAVMLEAGRWGLLAWLGEHVLVSDAADLSRVLEVSTDGRRRELQLAPSEVWAGSPNGRWLISVRGGRPKLMTVESGRPVGVGVPVRARGVLAEGSWAPDSSRVAAIVLGAAARLVSFEPENPSALPFRGSRGASGPVLWSKDGSVVIASRDAGLTREVAVCRLQSRSCSPLFGYEEGVALLGVVGG